MSEPITLPPLPRFRAATLRALEDMTTTGHLGPFEVLDEVHKAARCVRNEDRPSPGALATLEAASQAIGAMCREYEALGVEHARGDGRATLERATLAHAVRTVASKAATVARGCLS